MIERKFIIASGIIVVLIIAIGLILMSQQTKENDTEKTPSEQAKELYLKAIQIGAGVKDYSYSYEEDRAGYRVKTIIISSDNDNFVSIEAPLSKKSVYLLKNDSIVCMKIKAENETCAYAENSTQVMDYLTNIRRNYLLFFTNESVSRTLESTNLSIEKGFLIFENKTQKRKIGNIECLQINFIINYSGWETRISLIQANRLGLSLSGPREFLGYFCVDEKTGEPYEKYFNYSFRGKNVYTHFKLIDSQFNKKTRIEKPKNISNQLLSTLIENEKIELQDFIKCYEKDDNERERCIYGYAIDNKLMEACEYATEKQNTCYINIATIKKNEQICEHINELDSRDDCYIEVGGVKRDSTVCNAIINETKKLRCTNVSTDKTVNVSSNLSTS